MTIILVDSLGSQQIPATVSLILSILRLLQPYRRNMYHSNSTSRIDDLVDMHPSCKIHPEFVAWKCCRVRNASIV